MRGELARRRSSSGPPPISCSGTIVDRRDLLLALAIVGAIFGGETDIGSGAHGHVVARGHEEYFSRKAWGLRTVLMKLTLAAMFIAVSTATSAHDWYEDKFDPQMKYKCCGGFDCRAVPQSSVQSRTDGGYTYLPHNFTIPPDRVQESPDGQYHICEDTYFGTNQAYWRCFFAPHVHTSRL